jgi:hypothetical protein
MFALNNRSRNRRVAFLATLVLGALAGAGISKTAGSAAALFVSACGKLIVAIMYLFNPAERPSPADCEVASACSTAPQTREGSVHQEGETQEQTRQ